MDDDMSTLTYWGIVAVVLVAVLVAMSVALGGLSPLVVILVLVVAYLYSPGRRSRLARKHQEEQDS
jgi:general stress protein CsbA